MSFDVEALFPNVLTDIALLNISNWINDQDISDKEATKFVELTKLCLKQTFLQWRRKIFKQTSGLSMGHSLSPLAANVFMSNLEVTASKEEWLPRKWLRYVDDVIAIIKKGTAHNILKKINQLSPTIKFTFESEKDGKIPFLDLRLINQTSFFSV